MPIREERSAKLDCPCQARLRPATAGIRSSSRRNLRCTAMFNARQALMMPISSDGHVTAQLRIALCRPRISSERLGGRRTTDRYTSSVARAVFSQVNRSAHPRPAHVTRPARRVGGEPLEGLREVRRRETVRVQDAIPPISGIAEKGIATTGVPMLSASRTGSPRPS